jgi:hypothetical protein
MYVYLHLNILSHFKFLEHALQHTECNHGTWKNFLARSLDTYTHRHNKGSCYVCALHCSYVLPRELTLQSLDVFCGTGVYWPRRIFCTSPFISRASKAWRRDTSSYSTHPRDQISDLYCGFVRLCVCVYIYIYTHIRINTPLQEIAKCIL